MSVARSRDERHLYEELGSRFREGGASSPHQRASSRFLFDPQTLSWHHRNLKITVSSFNCHPSLSQNAELLSSLESASVRIYKSPSFPPSAAAPPRFQPCGPLQTSTPPVSCSEPGPGFCHGPPPLDSPRMATIQEDPSLDSHLDEGALEEAFGRLGGGAQRSFEDLTEKSVTSRSERAMLFRLQRQNQIKTKETQCWGGVLSDISGWGFLFETL